jgi:hypothetical protein
MGPGLTLALVLPIARRTHRQRQRRRPLRYPGAVDPPTAVCWRRRACLLVVLSGGHRARPRTPRRQPLRAPGPPVASHGPPPSTDTRHGWVPPVGIPRRGSCLAALVLPLHSSTLLPGNTPRHACFMFGRGKSWEKGWPLPCLHPRTLLRASETLASFDSLIKCLLIFPSPSLKCVPIPPPHTDLPAPLFSFSFASARTAHSPFSPVANFFSRNILASLRERSRKDGFSRRCHILVSPTRTNVPFSYPRSTSLCPFLCPLHGLARTVHSLTPKSTRCLIRSCGHRSVLPLSSACEWHPTVSMSVAAAISPLSVRVNSPPVAILPGRQEPFLWP